MYISVTNVSINVELLDDGAHPDQDALCQQL